MARGVLLGFDRTNPVEEFRSTTIGASGGTVAIETYTTSTRTGSGRAVRIVRNGALVGGEVRGQPSIVGTNDAYGSFVLRASMRVPSGITNTNWVPYLDASASGSCEVQVRRNAGNFDLRLADASDLNTVDCGSGYAYDAWHEIGFMRDTAPATDTWALRIGGGTIFSTSHDYIGTGIALLRLGFTDSSTENAEVVFDDVITERQATGTAVAMDDVNDGRWLVLLLPSADDTLGFPGAAPHFSKLNDQSDATTITAAAANTYEDKYDYAAVAGAMPIPADTLPSSTPVRSVAVLMRGNNNAVGGTVTGRLTINGVTKSTAVHTTTLATSTGCASSTGPFSIATLNAGTMGIHYTAGIAGTAGTYAEVWGYAEIEAVVAPSHNLRDGGSTETISSLTTTVTTSDVPVHSTVHDITNTFDLDATETDIAASPDIDVTLDIDGVPASEGTPDKAVFTPAGDSKRIYLFEE